MKINQENRGAKKFFHVTKTKWHRLVIDTSKPDNEGYRNFDNSGWQTFMKIEGGNADFELKVSIIQDVRIYSLILTPEHIKRPKKPLGDLFRRNVNSTPLVKSDFKKILIWTRATYWKDDAQLDTKIRNCGVHDSQKLMRELAVFLGKELIETPIKIAEGRTKEDVALRREFRRYERESAKLHAEFDMGEL